MILQAQKSMASTLADTKLQLSSKEEELTETQTAKRTGDQKINLLEDRKKQTDIELEDLANVSSHVDWLTR